MNITSSISNFTPRRFFGSVNYHDRIYITGGQNDEALFSELGDTFISNITNEVHIQQPLLLTLPFYRQPTLNISSPHSSSQLLSCGGSLHLFNVRYGDTHYNDVYTMVNQSSQDQRWIKVEYSTEMWSPRENPSVFRLPNNSTLLMFGHVGGGGGGGVMNDIWMNDGCVSNVSGWKKIQSAPFTVSDSEVIYWRNEVIVLGGVMIVTDDGGSGSVSNEVWSLHYSSSNQSLSTQWIQHLNAPWPSRSVFGSAVYNDSLYISGGYVGFGPYINDFWVVRSFDELRSGEWISLSSAVPWSSREGHSMLVYGSSLILLGGYTNLPTFHSLNDVSV